jgi:hypothetical protein
MLRSWRIALPGNPVRGGSEEKKTAEIKQLGKSYQSMQTRPSVRESAAD